MIQQIAESGLVSADEVAAIMASELGWDAATAAAYAQSYRGELAHERRVGGLPETHLAAAQQTADA